MDPGFTEPKQVNMHTEDPPCLKSHLNFKTQGTSGPTKWTLVQQRNYGCTTGDNSQLRWLTMNIPRCEKVSWPNLSWWNIHWVSHEKLFLYTVFFSLQFLQTSLLTSTHNKSRYFSHIKVLSRYPGTFPISKFVTNVLHKMKIKLFVDGRLLSSDIFFYLRISSTQTLASSFCDNVPILQIFTPFVPQASNYMLWKLAAKFSPSLKFE